jgi:hypothetical protein
MRFDFRFSLVNILSVSFKICLFSSTNTVVCCLELIRLRPQDKITQYPRGTTRTGYINVTPHSSVENFLKLFKTFTVQITKRQLVAHEDYSSVANCWTNFESCLEFFCIYSTTSRGIPHDVLQYHGWEKLLYIISYPGRFYLLTLIIIFLQLNSLADDYLAAGNSLA